MFSPATRSTCLSTKIKRVSFNTRIATIFAGAALAIAGTMATQHEGTRYEAY